MSNQRAARLCVPFCGLFVHLCRNAAAECTCICTWIVHAKILNYVVNHLVRTSRFGPSERSARKHVPMSVLKCLEICPTTIQTVHRCASGPLCRYSPTSSKLLLRSIHTACDPCAGFAELSLCLHCEQLQPPRAYSRCTPHASGLPLTFAGAQSEGFLRVEDGGPQWAKRHERTHHCEFQTLSRYIRTAPSVDFSTFPLCLSLLHSASSIQRLPHKVFF